MPRLHPPSPQTSRLDVDVEPIDDSPFLSLDPVDDLGVRGSHALYIALEPTVWTEAAVAVAGEVIERLHAELDRRRTHTATAALLSAVEMTNAWLVQANRIRPIERRAYFGLSCVLARGDELYIAQVAPSQILIAQEGELYAFPGLDSWHRADRGDDDEITSPPLGVDHEVQPELYHTQIEGGDVVVLCSSSLASVIAREPRSVFTRADSETIRGHLARLARDYEVDESYAAVIQVPASAERRDRGELQLFRRVTEWCSHFLPEETAERVRRRSQNRQGQVDPRRSAGQTGSHPAGVSSFAAAPGSDAVTGWSPRQEALIDSSDDDERWGPGEDLDEYDEDVDDRFWRPGAYGEDDAPDDAGQGRKRSLTELLAGAVLALCAAVVGVWQIAVHRDRAMGRPRDDGTLGLPRLQRYHDSVQMPDFTGVRRRMPRAPISRLTAVVALVLITTIVAALIYSIQTSRARDRQEQIDGLLQAAVVARQQATESADPAAAKAFLLASEARLNEAAAIGLDVERLAQERAANAVELDRALSVERLANIQVIGGVPAAPAGVAPRVFFGNGQLYVFTDALYRLDADGTNLVRLIGAGDQVGGGTVGTLLGAAWGDGAPIAFDGVAAYLLDPTTATWTRQEVGSFGTPYDGIASVNGYIGNLYLLTPGSGQILRFGAGAFDVQPDDWTAGLYTEDLRLAVDMEIDGRIYVLLSDGRILDLFMSALEHTYTPNVLPRITNAVALSAQPDRPFFYVADGENRIIRLTRDGQLVQQFMAAADAPPLTGIRDIAVDDGLGIAYVLTDQAILSVRLPGPPR